MPLYYLSGSSTPGGANTQLQYNNAGVFGGITNATSDGTTLAATSPKIITAINDTNGNSLIALTATASAVYGLTLANAALLGTVALGVTAPTVTLSSVAGTPISITAAAAAAGNTNNGAAAGGAVTIQGGAAARLVSGNADGGSINLVGGAGIGTGVAGQVVVPVGTVARPGICFAGNTNYGFSMATAANITVSANGGDQFSVLGGGLRLASGRFLSWSATTDSTAAADAGISRAAIGVLKFDNGAGTIRWYNWAGEARVSTQFDKTNTTLADVTGLSVALLTGRTYRFTARLYVTEAAVGGEKFAIAYSSTNSAFIVQAIAYSATTGLAVASTQSLTAGATLASSATGETSSYICITGTITTTGAGNLTVQFAQNTANGTSSVLVGSEIIVMDTP